MATSLASAVAALDQALGDIETVSQYDLDALWTKVLSATAGPTEADWGPVWDQTKKQQVAASLEQFLPELVDPYVQSAATVTAQWYDDLAPDEPYKAAIPDEIIPLDRIKQSIGWAVNTAADATTALSQLKGSVQRMVLDAQRETVVHNAKAEGVKYRRAAHGGACNWCLLMATKGAVYSSAGAAVKGHDNCHCTAVPVRKGTSYEPPPEVMAAADKYEQAKEQLQDAGKMVTLDSVVKQMDNIDLMAAQAAETIKTEEWLKAEHQYKVKESKKAAAAKYAAKKKAAKDKAAGSWFEAEKKAQAQWLVAEATHKANLAATEIVHAEGKSAKSPAQALSDALGAKHEELQTKTAAAAKGFHDILAEAKAEAASKSPAAQPVKPIPPGSTPPGWLPPPGGLTYVGPAGGSHGAKVYVGANGQEWIVKQESPHHQKLDEATARFQHMTGLTAPETYTITIDGKLASAQRKFKGGNAFGSVEFIDPTKLNSAARLDLQKQQVLDWLLANHDTHAQQWVHGPSGELVGIDKGQAFKWYGKDKLSWDFHPNKAFAEHESVYNTYWKSVIAGKTQALDPSKGELAQFIAHVQSIPDSVVRDTFRPYAEAAAKAGKLCSDNAGTGLKKPGGVPPNDVDAFLDAVIARKNALDKDFQALHAQAAGKAPHAPLPPTAAELGVVQGSDGIQASVAMVQKAQVEHAASLAQHAKEQMDAGAPLAAQAAYEQATAIAGMTPQQYAEANGTKVAQALKGKVAISPAAQALDAETLAAQKALADKLVGTAGMDIVTGKGYGTFLNTMGAELDAAKTWGSMTPYEYAKAYPSKVTTFKAKGATAAEQATGAVIPGAVTKPPTPAQEGLVDQQWSKLGPDAQKKTGKALAAAKYQAKIKGDSAKYLQLDAMAPKDFHAWKSGFVPLDYKAKVPGEGAVAPSPTPPAAPAASAMPPTGFAPGSPYNLWQSGLYTKTDEFKAWVKETHGFPASQISSTTQLVDYLDAFEASGGAKATAAPQAWSFPQPAANAFSQLPLDEQKKAAKALASAKFNAKKKGDDTLHAQLDSFGPAEYWSWKKGLVPQDYKASGAPWQITPALAPEPPPEPPVVGYLAEQFAALTPEEKKKAGKQLAAAKHQAKVNAQGAFKDPNAAADFWKYDQWTAQDFWAAKQLKTQPKLNPIASIPSEQLAKLQQMELSAATAAVDEWLKLNPGKVSSDAPMYPMVVKITGMHPLSYKGYLLNNGQTSMLGSPLQPSYLPGAMVSTPAAPPKNPPTDPAKLAKIAEWQTQKAIGGFNPVKAFNPTGSLKTNIEAFDAEIGVGYLTDDQLYQAIWKLPKTQQAKLLKNYADAKGQAAADAVQAKLQPYGQPSVVSGPTSAGVKPTTYGQTYNGLANVQVKEGTKYTPVRANAAQAVNELSNPATGVNLAVPDPSAPVGSAGNPHVFGDGNEYQAFGSLLTDQTKGKWMAKYLKPITSYTGSGYGSMNKALRASFEAVAQGKAPSPTMQAFDGAFHQPNARPTEEWVILSRSASRREFNVNDAGVGPWPTGGGKGSVAELKPLEGHAYTQKGYGSTSLSTAPHGMSGKHVRVIYRIPPGSRLVYVDGEPGGYNRLSSVGGEREVILPRESTFKVLEVRESTHPKYSIDVVVELMAQAV